MKVVNKSDYGTKDIQRLTRLVVSKLKKTFVLPEIGTITVESYDSARWEGQYDGDTEIKVRIGRKVKFPAIWDKIVVIPAWEDLFVGLFTWCVCLHYQKAKWAKLEKQAGAKPRTTYRRADCQEITVRMLNRWRVESEMKMIFEKAGI